MQSHCMEQRDVLIQNAVISAKQFVKRWKYQLNAEFEGEKNMSRENSEDVVLFLEQEVQREMFLYMDGIMKENKRTLWWVACPCKKIFVIPCNLLNEAFEHQINYSIDIDKEQFNMERKRIQVFMAVPTLQEEALC